MATMNFKNAENANVHLVVTPQELKEFGMELLNEYRAQVAEEQRGDQLVSRSETMAELKVSEVTLWRWEQSGYLKPRKVGARVFYLRADIDAIKRG